MFGQAWRLHPATLWGGGLVMIGAVFRNWISHTDLSARTLLAPSSRDVNTLSTWPSLASNFCERNGESSTIVQEFDCGLFPVFPINQVE